MSWAFWLTAAVVVSVLFALFGVKPRGARPVANSQMMLIARIVLVIVIVLLFYMYLRGRSGG
ncbi:MAG TPA: hypothetical protein VIA45_01670 [Thermoanaerobaculia bacterium]|jgi:hypothetical protein